jgi:hypothetical protein
MSTRTSHRRAAVSIQPRDPGLVCRNLAKYDAQRKTPTTHPLHHDNACPIHSHILTTHRR